MLTNKSYYTFVTLHLHFCAEHFTFWRLHICTYVVDVDRSRVNLSRVSTSALPVKKIKTIPDTFGKLH